MNQRKKISAIFLALVALFVFLAPSKLPARAAGTVSITSAQIEGSNVIVKASASSVPSSDDGLYHLFALKMYEASPSGTPVASAAAGTSATFSFALNKGTASSHLYNKFAVATLNGGSYTIVSNFHYITNPEALATNTSSRKNESNKKGIWGNNLGGLNAGQTAYNFNIHQFSISESSSGNWNYNGKTWSITGNFSGYDELMKKYNNQGLAVTMVVLNGYKDAEFVYPTARDGGGSCPYYMLNTADQRGLEKLEALMSYISNRYNGSTGHGQIDNWVIGNEVNAYLSWNYLPYTDVGTYSRIYADSLRICYNAIMSENKNANVCMCIDQMWDRNRTSDPTFYDGRDVLDNVNAYIKSEGNINWGLAQHPYNTPLYWTPFWTPMTPYYGSLISHDAGTDMLTMENIEVLTDYLCQSAYLNNKGQVRPVYLTECGYSSAVYGDQNSQAAGIIYAYNRVIRNQYIKGIFIKNLEESGEEIAQNLYFGILDSSGNQKVAYAYFRDMNTGGADNAVAFAQSIIGADKWANDMSAYSR
ncbi:MAG: hypothetical protein K5754_06260 [Butyrivibrio sp.]|nr:hypothetical protein [Butyrivibrio sp.]